jgi:hypothetical protein
MELLPSTREPSIESLQELVDCCNILISRTAKCRLRYFQSHSYYRLVMTICFSGVPHIEHSRSYLFFKLSHFRNFQSC